MNDEHIDEEIEATEEQHQLEEHHQDYYDILQNQKLSMRDITDHLTGPVISGVLHIIGIAFLSSIIVFEPAPELNEIEIEMVELEIKAMEEPPAPPEPPEEVESDDVEVEIDRPDMEPAPEAEAPVADINITDSALQIDISDIMGGGGLLMEGNSSALTLDIGSTFKMRSVTGRAKMLDKFNVSAKADTAVTKALKYFQKIQAADGSWEKSPAMTGLATLCFLAHGETPESPEYGPTVMKGIKKLISYSENLDSKQGKRLISNSGRGYGHAIVAYALSEAYALTKIPMVKEAMDNMIEMVIKGMNKYGSYDYNFVQTVPKGGHGEEGSVRSDLSLAGWQYQAMKAAFAAGSNAKGLAQAIDKSIKGLKKTHYTRDGGFSYGGGANGGGAQGKATMVSVGSLCLQLLGEGKSKEAKTALKWLAVKKYQYPNNQHFAKHKTDKTKKEMKSYIFCDWEKAPQSALYLWYYMTQALFQASTTKTGNPKAWREWNASFTKVLIEEQNPDGSWDDPKVKNPKLHLHGSTKGVYPTALCTLMLEVYYRYLPTFKLHGGHTETAQAKDDADDLGITF